MPKVISFINMKGGVGKTTLAVNVAYGLAHFHKQHVLLVDIDPQFNASTYLMSDDDYLAHIEDKNRHTVLDIFKKRLPPIQSVHSKPRKSRATSSVTLASCTHNVYDRDGRLDLIPSTLALMELQMSSRGTENRLANFLKKVAQGYDYIVIDCPPTISFFTQAAVLASDEYLVPIRPDPLAAIGLPLLERWLSDYTEDAGRTLVPVGIIFTYVRGPLPNTMRDIMDDLRKERGDEVFQDYIGERTKIATSVEEHLPVFRYAPNTEESRQFRAVTREFFTRTSGATRAAKEE